MTATATLVPPLRAGAPTDAAGILHLVEDNLAEGHLLPRTFDDVARHAHRFLVAEDEGGRIVACAELAPLSAAVAEVRSLVVDAAWRQRGLGSRLIEALGAQARRAGFSMICAFTHGPGPFVRLGFSIAPHVWFPEKIALDCTGCAKFRSCGQFALVLSLDGAQLEPGAVPAGRRVPSSVPAPVPLRVAASPRVRPVRGAA